MPLSLLTAHDATDHVHLIVGSNPLANARCAKSIEVGAKPIVVAPADAQVHYALQKKIDDGNVQWVQRAFEDADLKTMGRGDVENVVDAVFVTLGGKHPTSTKFWDFTLQPQLTTTFRYTYFHPVPKTTHSSQRHRCSQSMHIHLAVDSFRWTSPDRYHNIRQRVQASLTHTAGCRCLAPTKLRSSN